MVLVGMVLVALAGPVLDGVAFAALAGTAFAGAAFVAAFTGLGEGFLAALPTGLAADFAAVAPDFAFAAGFFACFLLVAISPPTVLTQ
jgi:hypothetical protein